MSTYTPQQLHNIGRQGGTVSTNGMSDQDRQKVDLWVNKGKNGS